MIENGYNFRGRLLSQSAFNLESLKFLLLPPESVAVGGQPAGLQFSFFVSASVIEGPIYLEEEERERGGGMEAVARTKYLAQCLLHSFLPARNCETMAGQWLTDTEM